MLPPSRWNDPLAPDDEGSASLEFLVGGLLLLVPIVYLVVALGLIQHGAFGAEAAARQTARAVSLATDAEQASERAELVRDQIAAEYGMEPGSLAVRLECPDTAGGCPVAGAMIVVTVTTEIRLPLVPPILGLENLAVVPVEASAVQKASRLWGQ